MKNKIKDKKPSVEQTPKKEKKELNLVILKNNGNIRTTS